MPPPLDPNTMLRGSLAIGLRRLSQWVHTRSWRHWGTRQLSATQLKVLQGLDSRPEGLSLTQVARELGTTPATVCDCVGALKKKALVRTKRNPQDHRQQTLRLTAKGEAIAHEALNSDPLLEVFAGLSVTEQQLLQLLWLKMIYALEARGALPPQRTCVRCQFFRPFCAAHSNTPHRCLQAQRPLTEGEVRFDCPVFEAADWEAQRALWEAFVNGTARSRAADAAFQHRVRPAPAANGVPG